MIGLGEGVWLPVEVEIVSGNGVLIQRSRELGGEPRVTRLVRGFPAGSL